MYTIFKKDYFHLRIVQQRHRLKHEHLYKLGDSFDCYAKHSVSISSVDEHTDGDSHPSEKSPPKANSPSRHRHLRLIPKLINAFGNNRPKSISFTSTSSNNDSSTKASPVNGELSPWATLSINPMWQKASPLLSAKTAASDQNHAHRNGEPQSADVIPSLIAQLPSSIGFNCDE